MLFCKNWMYAAPCLGSVGELALKVWRQVSWPAPHWLQHSGKYPCTSPVQHSRACPGGVGMGEPTWGHRGVEEVAGSTLSWERERWQTGELASLGELVLPLASCHRQEIWPHPLPESWPWWRGCRRAINSVTAEGQIRGFELSYFHILSMSCLSSWRDQSCNPRCRISIDTGQQQDTREESWSSASIDGVV